MRRVLDDHYEFLLPLHAGSTGVLHYAWDLPGQRPVVVREIPVDVAIGLMSDPGALTEFSRIAALSHAGIVDVHAVRKSAAGAVYVAASYIDGLDLQSVLTRLERLGKRMPPPLACFIAGEILASLDHLHRFGTSGGTETGLAHGALRPSRVMLGVQGAIRLTDLIAARLARRSAGSFPGELADERASDLLAAGWMLFQMLSGRSPTAAGWEFGTVATRGIEKDELFALEESHCPAPIRRIVAEALAPERSLRYPSARSMRDDLAPAAPATGDPAQRAETANLVLSLVSDEEDQRRRRLIAMRGRGGAIATGDRIETTDLLAVSPAAGPRVPNPAEESDGEEALSITQPVAGSGRPAVTDSPDRGGDPDGQSHPTGVERSRGLSVRGADATADPDAGAAPQPGRRRIVLLAVLVAVVIGVTITLGVLREAPLSESESVLPQAVSSEPAPVLRTIPAGAQVFVNGRLTGRTPFPYEEFAPGPLRLRFEYPGLVPVETLIVVRERAPLPLFRPFVLGAEIRFSSIPPGGRPVVDGHPLRDIERSSFTVAATDTVLVDFSLGEERAPSAARFNPLAGLIPPTDTMIWRWLPGSERNPPELRVVFSRPVRLHSRPPGALIFLDRDSVPTGRTNTTIDLPYGDHTVLLQKEPFLDYRFSFTVAGGTQDLYAPVLRRTVLLSAVRAPARRDSRDLGASILWISRNDLYVKSPEDRLKTPYSLQLAGVEHEVRFSLEGFADTSVILLGDASALVVGMRALAPGERNPGSTGSDLSAWVRFVVRQGRRGFVSGAEVIGVEKNTGDIVRYGLTDAAGEFLTRVPLGDYEWRASKEKYRARTNDERISSSRKTKRVTLQLTPR